MKHKRKKRKISLQKTSQVFQIVGGFATLVFFLMSLGVVGQTQFPSVIGIDYNVTSTPFKVMLYASFGIVAGLSFLIAYITKKQSKRRK